MGDLADLAERAAWSGYTQGAGYVLVTPLHAADPVQPVEASPYLPTTRRFVSPLYLRVEAVPESAYLPPAARLRGDALAADARRQQEFAELIDRDAIWAAKLAALELVYGVPRCPGREAAYPAFRGREGQALVDFATWGALAEQHGPIWSAWPPDLQDPRSDAVAAARDRLAQRVDLHCWLQWLTDEQVEAAHRAAVRSGM